MNSIKYYKCIYISKFIGKSLIMLGSWIWIGVKEIFYEFYSKNIKNSVAR